MLDETGVSLLSGGYFNTDDTGLNARLAFVDFDGDSILKAMREQSEQSSNKPKLSPSDHYNMEFLEKHTPKCVEGIDRLCEWLDKLRD